MKTDPPDLDKGVAEVMRGICDHAGQPGDYVLIGRATVAPDGSYLYSYDWFWRLADDDPRWKTEAIWSSFGPPSE